MQLSMEGTTFPGFRAFDNTGKLVLRPSSALQAGGRATTQLMLHTAPGQLASAVLEWQLATPEARQPPVVVSV